MDDMFGHDITRREFLKKASLGLASLGITIAGLNKISNSLLFAQPDNDSKSNLKSKMRYRKLGKTNLMLSEIAFNGALLDSGTSVISYCMDMGLNYVDTAPEYDNSEQTIGKILKYRPKELIIGTKWDVNDQTTTKKLIDSVDASLDRLEIESIDIIQVWAARRKSQVHHKAVFEAFELLKAQKKVKHLGITTHINEMEVAKETVQSNRYEMMLVSYNYANHKVMNPIIDEAASKNIGVIAQFIEDGYENIPSPNKGTLRGAVEWVLSNKNITSVIVPLRSVAQADEILKLPSVITR